jgi:hypothetical protein
LPAEKCTCEHIHTLSPSAANERAGGISDFSYRTSEVKQNNGLVFHVIHGPG